MSKEKDLKRTEISEGELTQVSGGAGCPEGYDEVEDHRGETLFYYKRVNPQVDCCDLYRMDRDEYYVSSYRGPGPTPRLCLTCTYCRGTSCGHSKNTIKGKYIG